MKPTQLTTDRVMKAKPNEIAFIVNSEFLGSPYDGKDWGAVRVSLIKRLSTALSTTQEEAVNDFADWVWNGWNLDFGNKDRAVKHFLAHLNKINSGQSVTNHFPDIGKMVKLSKGRKV